jgi:hypothetical protein
MVLSCFVLILAVRILLYQFDACLRVETQVGINVGKWSAPVLTSYASSVVDVANPRFQTMNVWINGPTFIVPRAGRQHQKVTTLLNV